MNPLHSAHPDDLWRESDLGSTYQNRLHLHNTLRTTQEWPKIRRILGVYKNNIRDLATILNDCPEWARRKALTELKSKSPSTYSKCIDAISEFQINKHLLDPNNLFPCVATENSIKEPTKHCQRCEKAFEEGDDIYWSELLLASCHACYVNYPSLKSLPVETLENITGRLTARDAGSVAQTSSRFLAVAKDRLNPVVYLSSAFSNSISLIAAMADNGCVVSGSRALDFFVPGSAEEESDWDFYVNGYAMCVARMLKALEDSGVEWDLLGDRVRRFLRGDEGSMKIKVGELQNVLSWNLSGLFDDFEDEVRHFFFSLRKIRRSVRNLSRSGEITVLKVPGTNKAFNYIFPSGDERTMGEEDPSTASAEGNFSVITGRISTKRGSSKVQLIVCHSYGIPLSCLQVISRFHSTPAQCFLGGFGAGHMFYDITASKTGIIWNYKSSNQEPSSRGRRRIEALGKYRRRGFELRDQGDAEWPPERVRLGHRGTYFMEYTKLYKTFEGFSSNFPRQAHPVALFVEGLNWGLRNTMWSLEDDGPHNETHWMLKTARKNFFEKLPAGFPAYLLNRTGGPRDFSLTKYVSEHAPLGTPGVKRHEGIKKLYSPWRRLALSGSVGRLPNSSSVMHLL